MLETLFPKLGDNYVITSSENPKYNCIAWAYGDDSNCFWPMEGYYWPDDIACEVTIEAFMELFASIRYQCCNNPLFEPGYEKVAIYVLDDIPTHAARQLNNGKWTSKLGQYVDIEHDTLECLNGVEYGDAVIFMRREI